MSIFKKFAVFALTGVVGASFASYFLLIENRSGPWPTVCAEVRPVRTKTILPSRNDQIKSLRSEKFDILIIGGGVVGSGCALDATTRGLKTALVERNDFSSGSSSKTSKIIHGSIRDLQLAIMYMDYKLYVMVKEALHERRVLLTQAPHLAYATPFMLPAYHWWQVPYYWFGIKMYNLVAGLHTMKPSYYLSKTNSLEVFPMLRRDDLCGGIVYYDGMMNDSRFNISIVLTAAKFGATVANHVSVTGFMKEKIEGREVITGAHVKDELSGKTWSVTAKCVINATGPYIDDVRKVDNPAVKKMCFPTSGTHITLPGYYTPQQMALLDPVTSEGRAILFFPWQNHTIVCAIDTPCKETLHPVPTEDDLTFLLGEIKNYLDPDVDVRRGDILSAWTGVRPLVTDPNKFYPESLGPKHIVLVSDSNLVSVAGGKWTTYRLMAADAVYAAIKACNLSPNYMCDQTEHLRLMGAKDWTPSTYIRLVQDFGMDVDVAQHLSNSYGYEAFAVAEMATLTGKRWPVVGKRLHAQFPYIDAEVRYGVRHEYAMTAIDMIARRLRLAYLNVHAAQEVVKEIVDIMGEELKWSKAEKQKQIKEATEFIQKDMGQNVIRTFRHEVCKRKIPLKLSSDEIRLYTKRFNHIDKDQKGYISINDIRKSFKQYGEKEVPSEELHEIIKAIDTTMNGQLKLDEYLQLVSAIKFGYLNYSKYGRESEAFHMQRLGKMLKTTFP